MSHRPPDPAPRRIVVLGVLAALLVAGVALDRGDRRGVRAPASAGPSISSTWYCSGATAAPEGRADGAVVVANPDDAVLTGTVTVIGQEVEPVERPLEVPPRSRLGIPYRDLLTAPYAAAVVELRGGTGVVEQFVEGPLGHTATPCLTDASSSWYVADGSTARDALMVLSLFNPFPEDAIADLSFATDQGRAVPADFQGIVVPARRVVAVDVGSHVRRREEVAATVSARSGRLVVHKMQLRTGAPPGITVTPAVAEPARDWYFPEGVTGEGLREQLHLYNPSADEGRAEVALALETGDIEPFELTLPPRGRITLDVSAEERVPKGVPHGIVVASTNGVPLVVERSISSGPPSLRVGRTASVGSPASARTWGFAIGAATPAYDEWLAVLNTGAGEVTFSVTALADGQPLAVEGLQDVPVAAGRRFAVRLGDHVQRESLALVVTASGPVVVERDLYQVTRSGMSSAPGLPLD